MNKFKINKWFKPGLYTTMDKFSVVFLGFVSFFILARVLSKNDFGVWVLFMSLTSILETLREGFIKQPLIAFLTAPTNRDQTGSASFFLNLVYSLIISILILLVSYPLQAFWNAEPLSYLLKVYSITNLLFVPFSHFEYLQQSKMDFKGIFFSHFTRALIPTLLILVAVLFDFDLQLTMLANISLLGVLLGALVSWYFGSFYRHSFVKLSWVSVKQMIGFGKYSLGTNLGSLIMRNIDSWMLGKMISTESVAIYNPAIRISNLVEIPTLTIANLVFPKMAENFGKHGKDINARLYEKSVALLLGLMIPGAMFVFFFSDWIVLVIAGSKYVESGYILKITAFYMIFIPFMRQFGILLDASRRPEINFLFIIGTTLMNLVTMYLFIEAFGIVGAAFATLITYTFRFVAQQIILKGMFEISLVNIFRLIIKYYIRIWALITQRIKTKIESKAK